MADGLLVGTPEQLTERLKEVSGLGMSYAILNFAEVAYDRTSLNLFTEKGPSRSRVTPARLRGPAAVAREADGCGNQPPIGVSVSHPYARSAEERRGPGPSGITRPGGTGQTRARARRASPHPPQR
jgi:hypothetical protein